jgi:hypothetical protein
MTDVSVVPCCQISFISVQHYYRQTDRQKDGWGNVMGAHRVGNYTKSGNIQSVLVLITRCILSSVDLQKNEDIR